MGTMPRLSTIMMCGLAALPAVTVAQSTIQLTDDPASHELVITVGPVDLPAMAHTHHMARMDAMAGPEQMHMDPDDPMVFPPLDQVVIPFDLYLHGFSYKVVDDEGKELTPRILHHMNLITADKRELFLPISQRLLAVGSETGNKSVPGDVIGLPVEHGEHVVVAVMLHNPTGKPHKGVRLELRLQYRKPAEGVPTYVVFPFQMDVGFPAGDKSVDLPPGASSFSWEGSPAVPGKILVIGGHMHDHAVGLTLEDATTDSVLWTGDPEYDGDEIVGVTTDVFDDESAIALTPDHTYRVSVRYDNPLPDTLYNGGMGVIAGVFQPDPGARWPAADTTNFLYRVDRLHYTRKVRGRYATIVQKIKAGEVQLPDDRPRR